MYNYYSSEKWMGAENWGKCCHMEISRNYRLVIGWKRIMEDDLRNFAKHKKDFEEHYEWYKTALESLEAWKENANEADRTR